MKVCIDYTKCTGIAMCESLDPDIFEVGEDGQSHVHEDALSEDKRALVDEAVQACPTGAISVID